MSKPQPSSTLGSGAFLSFKIARRFYQVKSSIRVLAFINNLTKIGIFLGISILLMTSSVINGFDRVLHDKFLNLIPQVVVYKIDGSAFQYGKSFAQQLPKFRNVQAISPLVSKTVLLEAGSKKRVLNLFGINPHSYSQVSNLEELLGGQSLATLLASPYDKDSTLSQAQAKVAYIKQQLLASNTVNAETNDSNSSQVANNYASSTVNNTADSASSLLPADFEQAVLTNPSIILGKQVANSLGVKVGDYVRVFVVNQGSALNDNQYFIVSAIVNSGGIFDRDLALVNIFDSGPLLGMGSFSCVYPQDFLVGSKATSASSDSASLANGSSALVNSSTGVDNGSTSEYNHSEEFCPPPGYYHDYDLANAFQGRLINPDLDQINPYPGWTPTESISYTTWGRVHANIKNDLPMVKSLLLMGLVFVVALASFNVICSIMIQIKDKKKSLTSLQATGLATSTIHQIFIFYSLILAGRAVLYGLILGVLLSLGLEQLSFYLLNSGVEILSASTYFIDYIPVSIEVLDMVLIALAIITVSVATAYLTSKLTNKAKVDLSLLS